jgi:(p)ppGpp synthase/HD superfamily hydrolase
MRYSDKFTQALSFAAKLHNGQLRKGTQIPYISHLLSVSAIVMRNGGDEEQAIAALLHDSVEDQGGINLLSDIESKFGARVAKIVKQCSDSFEKPKPPWDQRKKAYVATIAHKSDDAILISMADKVDNARTILNNYHKIGEKLWERFRGGREGTLWYYRACVDAFGNRSNSDLYHELADLVSQIEDMAAGRQINQRK